MESLISSLSLLSISRKILIFGVETIDIFSESKTQNSTGTKTLELWRIWAGRSGLELGEEEGETLCQGLLGGGSCFFLAPPSLLSVSIHSFCFACGGTVGVDSVSC